MKSIKQGRTSSLISGIILIFFVIFGVFFTITLYRTTHDFTGFPAWLFGVVWTGVALVGVIINFYNAFAKNRISSIDIVDHKEESDPLDERIKSAKSYCPYCGNELNDDYMYCPNCGKNLREE